MSDYEAPNTALYPFIKLAVIALAVMSFGLLAACILNILFLEGELPGWIYFPLPLAKVFIAVAIAGLLLAAVLDVLRDMAINTKLTADASVQAALRLTATVPTLQVSQRNAPKDDPLRHADEMESTHPETVL